MKAKLNYIRNIILPCLIFSSLVGIITATVVFAFKYVASKIISFSNELYIFIRNNKIYLPLAIAIVIILSLLSYTIYKKFKTTRGGGIPTAIGILRGVFTFSWLPTFFGMILSSFITFFVGVPLGNEGPSVMLGTSIGRGLTNKCGRKNKAWDRYIMTGGACSGFAVATNAPISGIFFALEEAHQRFSPMIIMTACCSVMFGMVTSEWLSVATNINIELFPELSIIKLDIFHIWISIAIGIVVGLAAVLFSKVYALSNYCSNKIKGLKPLKFVLLFLISFFVGILSLDFIGTGHNLIEKLFVKNTTPIWYILILILIFRTVMTLLSNNEGITGGLFIPTLTIGAIVSSLLATLLVKLNLIDASYYSSIVAIGIACSIASMIKTPITAIIFSIEALGCFNNITFVIVGVAISYIITEIFKVKSFNELVIDNRLEKEHKDKSPLVVDTYLEAKKDCFAIGKSIRDIFWPNNLFVLSITHNENAPVVDSGGGKVICELDILHVRFETYNIDYTKEELLNILGEQEIKLTSPKHI